MQVLELYDGNKYNEDAVKSAGKTAKVPNEVKHIVDLSFDEVHVIVYEDAEPEKVVRIEDSMWHWHVSSVFRCVCVHNLRWD